MAWTAPRLHGRSRGEVHSERRVRSVALVLVLCIASGAADADETLRAEFGPLPGDAAPPLVASRWLRGDPVTQFAPGRVYVVDLWATWCPPCLATMPHMRELQARYPRDVTVIAMDVLEFKPAKVPSVVASWDSSPAITVAMDSIPAGKEGDSGLTAVAYAGNPEYVSLPTTYLVDRRGRIAWIGTPYKVDEPLARVVAGTWDVDAFATTHIANLRRERRYRDAVRPVHAALAKRDWQAAYTASDAVAAADSSFGVRIANQGFATIAMNTVGVDSASAQTKMLGRRAAERAAVLSPDDWRLHQQASDAALAVHDSAASRAHLQRAVELAPESERAKLSALLASRK
jgi:thiol-disulfide isomerase/thioredoxin